MEDTDQTVIGRPNFIIVGAPKSGTTALYEYLAQHPNVFMPRIKEPHHFSHDYAKENCRADRDAYLSLFQDVRAEHTAIGEASVHYIHSSAALPEIKRFDSTMKLIAMLRDPINLTYSYYNQQCYGLYEDAPTYQQAWELQDARRAGKALPPGIDEPKLLQYRHIGLLGHHVKNMLDVFPAEQVKLILFEDFVSDTKAVYDDVLDFLGVAGDNRTHFPRINESKTYRNKWLRYVIRHPPRVLRFAKTVLRAGDPTRGQGLRQRVLDWNSRPYERPKLPVEFQQALADEFREDVRLLSLILGRSLDHWLRPKP